MNRETRDRFASGTNRDDLTSGNACWETPPAIFADLHARYRFDVDLTADVRRALLPVWFGPWSPYAEDALTAPWAAHGRRGYSNPPYGPFVAGMLARAKAEASLGFFSLLLLPMRATKAFQAHVLDGASRLLFCDRRITFFENGAPRINPRTGRPDPALFDSILVIYEPRGRRRPSLRVGAYLVPAHVTASDIERARASA